MISQDRKRWHWGAEIAFFIRLKWILIGISCSFYLSAQTNEGTEFWFSFLEHRNPGLNTMVVMITSRSATNGVVSSPHRGFNRGFTVSPNEVTIIQLPAYAETTGSERIQQNGFRVVSEDPVSVYIHQYYQYRAEATVVLPVSTIGQSYYALSYEGYFTEGQIFPSELVVVAGEDETAITFELTANTEGGRTAGTVFEVLLNAGETYQIRGRDELDDLSGSFITGDKNFSLFCGNQYSALNCFRSGRDNLLEQAFPISTWGTRFVSAPFQKNLLDIFRILASEDNTLVVVYNNDGTQRSYVLDRGEFAEYEESRESYIESNRPILIAQYMNQLDCGNGSSGDPSMLYLNSVLQIRDTVTLYNSSFQNIRHNYINIISRTSDTALITFDGLPLAAVNTDLEFAGLNNEFVSATIAVNAGAHTIVSEGCGVIARAYGLGDYESYAYSGGASFNKINASPIPDGGCLNDTVFFYTELPEERFDVKWVLEQGDTIEAHRFWRIYESLGSFPAELYIHDRCFDLFDTLSKELQVTLRQSVETDPIGTFCEGDDVYLAATDVATAEYRWTGPQGYLAEEQFPVLEKVDLRAAGSYEVIGIVSGCATYPAELNLDVKVNPNPALGPDAIFCPKLNEVVEISPGPFDAYLWSDGSNGEFLAVSAKGAYGVTVTDEFGCTASDSISFIQRCPTEIYMPNIFSPNKDGINDAFGVFGEDILFAELRIFDKWGVEVFNTRDHNALWDGFHRTRPAAQGVYTWVLYVQGYDREGEEYEETRHGSLTLIR